MNIRSGGTPRRTMLGWSTPSAPLRPSLGASRPQGHSAGHLVPNYFLNNLADSLKVCPSCWVGHPDGICPCSKEGEALIKTFLHTQGGGAPLTEDVPEGGEGSGDVVMDFGDAPHDRAGTDMEAGRARSTVFPGVIPQHKSAPSCSVQGSKGVPLDQLRQVTFPALVVATLHLLWVRPGSQSQASLQTCKT